MSAPVDKPLVKRPALHWRIARHTVAGLLLLLLLVVLGAVLFLRNLDTSFIKTRLRNLAQKDAGLDLDYGSAQVDIFSGIVLNHFTVAQPPALRAITPTLMQAGMIQLGWTLFGQGPMLRHFVASDVTLTIIVDDSGQTSLDTLGDTPEKRAKKPKIAPTPGQQLAALLHAVPPFDRLQFSPLTVDVLQTHAGRVVARTELTGLDLRAVSTGIEEARNIEISLGDATHPLAVALSHDDGSTPAPPPPPQPEPAGHHLLKKKTPPKIVKPAATGTLFLDGKLGATEASIKAELDVTHQTLDKEWPKKGVLVALDATARSDGDALDVKLYRFEALAEAMMAKGALLLAPGRVRIDAAKGTADLTRLARLVPDARLPFALREGLTRYDIAGLDLDPTPKLDPGGHVELDVHATGLRLGGEECVPDKGAAPAPGCAALGKVEVDLDGMHLSLRGRPLEHGGVHLTASLPAELMTLTVRKSTRVALTHAATEIDATLPTGAPGHIEVRTRFDALSTGGKAGKLAAQAGSIDTHLSELRLDAKVPARSSGALASTLALSSLTTVARGTTMQANELKLAARARISDGDPSGVDVESSIARFTVTSARELLVPPGPAHVSARIEHIKLDREKPLESLAQLTLQASLGQITAQARVGKLRDAATFELTVDGERAGLITAFAPPSLALPARMSFALASKGRIDDLSAPRVKQHGTLRIEHAAVTLKQQTLAADSLDVALDSDGDRRRQELTLMLNPHRLQLDDEPLGDGRLTLHGKWDASRPAFDLELDGTGQALPAGHLAASFAWEAGARALRYKLDGELSNLEALSPLLPVALTDEHWLDLSDLRAGLHSHGQLSGVLTGFDKRGAPLVSPRPLETLRGDDELTLELQNFHYVDVAGVELSLPAVTLATKVRSDGARHRGEAELRIPDGVIGARGHKVTLHGLVDNIAIELTGDPRSGPIDATHKLVLARLQQDLFPLYPVGAVEQDTHVQRTVEGALQLVRFELVNGAGGTHLAAHGGLTLARAIARRDTVGNAEPIGFSSLGLNLAVTQKLEKLAGDPTRFGGSGTVEIAAELMSGDLRRYHATVNSRFHQVSFQLPPQHVRVVNLDGALPVTEDFVIEKGKARLFHAQSSNSYPQLRFSDQHPFQSGSGALSVDKISVGDLDIVDLVGNVRVARDQLAIDQMDAGLRGGRLAGQCVVDWRGADSTVSLRVRATGVEARHNGAHERFDGNAALNLALRERELDGRIEVLRIGRQHFYDLLDEVDAHHKDAAINRVRKALELGYPDHVQVVFDRGFASMAVTFGGLARLLKIHEVHGIPTGPLVERYLGPLLSMESP